MGEQYLDDHMDPNKLVTDMVEQRGYISTEISQDIQKGSNILTMLEPTKKPMENNAGDYVKKVIFDYAQPSMRDVIDHGKRIVSARPNNSPDDVPVRTIPYGSHTVEACLMGWAWDTDWFSKIDLAFKHKAAEQKRQVKGIFSGWSKCIWEKWLWRAYQRNVQNYSVSAGLPSQHGALGYPTVPQGILTLQVLDDITLELSDQAGHVGRPDENSWCILIGKEEFKLLWDEYTKEGARDFGRRSSYKMEDYRRHDHRILNGLPYYEINDYKFFVERRVPRFGDKSSTGSWDDALLDDILQNPATQGTESMVSRKYRDPRYAKYAETLIINTDAIEWMTPPLDMLGDNQFHPSRIADYSYSGQFVPVPKTHEQDPFGKKIKYYAEYMSGMCSIFPRKGAAILHQAAHINAELILKDYTLTPFVQMENAVAVQVATPVLPEGNIQIQTRKSLPNFADGYALFLRTASGKVAKLSATVSDECADMPYQLHTVTLNDTDKGGCVPRECDPWKEVVVLAEGTADSELLGEDGCELCGGFQVAAAGSDADEYCAEFTSDNVQSVTINSVATSALVSQVETFTTVADDTASLDATFIQLSDEDGTVGVWIDTDNSGTTIPAGASALDRAIEVTGVATDDTAEDVATAVAAAIDGDSKFSAAAVGAVVTVTHATAGSVPEAEDGDTGFTDFTLTTDGGSGADALETAVQAWLDGNGGGTVVVIEDNDQWSICITGMNYDTFTVQTMADGGAPKSFTAVKQ